MNSTVMKINNFIRMMKGMLMACSAILCGAMSAFAAESEDPIITFHTNVYENTEAENVFHIILGATENTYVDVDCGYGKSEVEVGPAVYNPDTQEVDGTFISCTVSKAGIVRVYGDPKLIDYVYMEGCYIDRISFPELTEVSVINLNHNELESLDLSHMTKLQAIYVSDNPFNKSPLVIGGPKNDLQILSMSMVGSLDPSFDLKQYPNLRSMEAYSTPSLTVVDPTNCPNLLQLSIDGAHISSLDVTKNPSLLILNISETDVTEIDLTKNTYLTEFYCTNGGAAGSRNQISALDLSHNKELKRLFCSDNLITELDISNNPLLTDLYANNNLMTSINLDNNQKLINLSIRNNNMDFVTLPEPRSTFSEYYYQQNAMPADRSYKVGSVLDYSARVLRPGTQTVASLIRINRNDPSGYEALSSEYYSYADGKVTLLKAIPDSVYVAYSNSMFREAVQMTTPFVVKTEEEFGKPSPIVTIGFSKAATNLTMSVGMAGATPENPKKFYVDFGDGVQTEFTATSSTLPETANIKGKRRGEKTIIYMPEGEDLTAFSVTQGRISTSDFSAATALQELTINNTYMQNISLTWNSLLRKLNLDNNMLGALDLSGASGFTEKNLLSDISAANNSIKTVTLNPHQAINKLNLSNNSISEILLEQCWNVTEMNLSHNKLIAIDLNDFESLVKLDASYNQLDSLPVPSYCPLKDLNISYNNVTFSNLAPAGSYPTYIYAPQNIVKLPTKAPSVNLAQYNFTDAAGQTTTFEWRTAADNNPVAEGDIEGTNGFFKFINTEMGEVYCTMTHPAFPDFAGENVYRTTDVLAAGMPQNVFCTFTTPQSARVQISLAGVDDNTVIYIDWKGDGTLTQYMLKDKYTLFNVVTKAGANVKCYSYEDNDNVTVFSMGGIRVSSIDASKMTQLITFSWSEGGINDDNIKYPQSPGLQELVLSNNKLTKLPDLSGYPALVMMNLSGNNIPSLDLSPYKNLQVFYGASMGMTELTLGNPKLWLFNISNNKLSNVDFSKAPALQQVEMSGNLFETADFSSNKGLKVLNLGNNLFTIATLPVFETPLFVYEYWNQTPLTLDLIDGKTVDLSAQAVRNGQPTEYHWFIDSPWLDDEGNLAGEELIINDEYTIENGVTTFLKPLANIVGVMTNPLFPNLYLVCNPIDVLMSGIEESEATKAGDAEYYTLTGIRVANPDNGIYIRRQGGQSTKVLIRK